MARFFSYLPNRSERASLATFAKTPNLDEHLNSVVMFFSDDTGKELRSQMDDRPMHPDSEQGQSLAASANDVLRSDAHELGVRLAQSVFDHHEPERGFFYGIVDGRTLGFFDVIYEPGREEPVLVGRNTANTPEVAVVSGLVQLPSSASRTRLSFHAQHLRLPTRYRHSSRSFHGLHAQFLYHASADDGRTVHLELSTRLRVTSATIDGKPAEYLQYQSADPRQVQGGAPLLLVAADPLAPETPASRRAFLSRNGRLSHQGRQLLCRRA